MKLELGAMSMANRTETDAGVREINIRIREKTYLVWKDLTVEARNNNIDGTSTKTLLNCLNGYAQPHRLMGVMGPSGSGKSTFLDALVGRLSANVIMTGRVLLSGKKGSIDGRDVSYATQHDHFLGTLTVRETLTYSAQLRLPNKMNKTQMNEIVEDTIYKMGLRDCAENKIGNWHLRGISNGEKWRLSISIQILTEPKVLLIDEPTTGLDSASAFFIMQVLKIIAHDGKIVVCSIHQPSSHLFDLFDDLLLLSSGKTIYFGDAKMAVKFFAEAGFPCPSRSNPSDHFLRCINSDFDNIKSVNILMPSDSEVINLSTEEIKAKLVEKHRNSENSLNIRKRVQDLALSEQIDIVSNNNNAKWWKQLCTLSRRSFLNMSRDMGYYWLRILFYILVSLSVGNLYFNIGLSNSAIFDRPKCDAFLYGFMICLSVGGLPFFIEEHKVSNHERINGHYGEAVFVLSNFISSFPFLVIISLCSGTIVYYMVKFHPGFSHYFYFCMNLFCCISVLETCMMVVALWVPNVLMGIGVGTSVIILMMMASAIFRTVSDLPKFFWRYPMSYLSFSSWAIQGEYKNDMIGLEFDPPVNGDKKLKGEEILQKIYGIELNHSKWWDLAALFCLLVSFRLILFATLKYKGKALPLLHRLYAKTIFQNKTR